MLVEDHASFRQVIKYYLQSEFPSMSIVEAANGVQAFKEIDSYPPDLIFMDIKLPGENGLELTARIKTKYPNVTVIILTSYDTQEYREAATQAKADHFLSKGSSTREGILTLVKSILNGK